MTASGPAAAGPLPGWGLAVVLALLFAGAFALYSPALHHPFIDLDDPQYVTENPHLAGGLTPAAVAWAFSSFDAANWHPLTWLSHLADVSLFGFAPAGHHFTSVLLHAVNTVLLFLFFWRTTRALWSSGILAALFAVHPLRVESVAWVAERKDVLSASFWLLTMLAYAAYAQRGGRSRYALVVALFALGLLAKPMLVTLPLALLLLDLWPLGRWRLARDGARDLGRLVLEKVPLLALAVLSSVITFVAQRRGGALRGGEFLPFAGRAANALLSYAKYIGKTLWPAALAPFYPLPATAPPLASAALSAALLLAISAAAVALVRRRPYLLVGWLWFLGTLAPVIGLIQVGEQAMADRYMYLPGIGLLVMAVWGLADLAGAVRAPRAALIAAAAGAVIALSAVTFVQLGYWSSTRTLFAHAKAVVKDNWFAEFVLGSALEKEGAVDQAIDQYRAALRLRPSRPALHNNLGHALFTQGRVDEAIAEYREALHLLPRFVGALNNLGQATEEQGRVDEAIRIYQQALQIEPDDPDVHNNLGRALFLKGRLPDAIGHYHEALRSRPRFPLAWSNLGAALGQGGDLVGAIAAFRQALAIDPRDAQSHYNLGVALSLQGSAEEAIGELREALRLNPRDADARARLAELLAKTGHPNP